MAVLDLKRKLAILSDAAKYGRSCAPAAHARAGRCVSLPKILPVQKSGV